MRKTFSLLLALAISTLALAASPPLNLGFGFGAQPKQQVFNPMGINFSAGGGATDYYEGFPIFKNRIRESAGFTNPSNFNVAASTDSSGWPNANFQVILWSSGEDTTPSWLTGTWDCGFVGTGSETIVAQGGDSVSNISHGSGGSYTTFNLTNVGANSGFTVTGVAGSVINDFCYLPEYPASVIDNPLASSAFTTEALAHYANYGWIRWMQWNNTIANATTMTSSNRLTPANTQASIYLSPTEGFPQEWAAAFSVAAGTGMWLNLPNLYDSGFTYVTSLANALKTMVPPGLPIYIELSNELWNEAGAGIVAWHAVADPYPGGNVAYYAYQTHSIAAIFRSIFGARYGTDVRFVMAWQSSGNGVAFQAQLYSIYASNGWAVGVNDGGDFYATSIAPYMNLSSPSNSWTIAQIDSNLTTVGDTQAFASYAEENLLMGMKYGLYQIDYEGGWQTGSESSGLTNGGASIMDSGMIAVMNNYYQKLADSGAIGIGTFSGGVDSNYAGNLAPVYELSTIYPIAAATAPRFASILENIHGWTSTRNIVTNPGAVIAGGNYVDTSAGTLPNLGNNGDGSPFNVPNAGTGGQVSYLECSTQYRIASLVVNFTNSGSAGTTGLEYGSAPAGFTILGGESPISVAVPNGTNNVTIGSVPIVPGCGYLTIGTPGTRQSGITINSLTLN